jgi:N-acetylmuramic acid 6-phosphate etherase
VSEKDEVIGIAASGTTPYVIGALEECRKRGIITGSIACNPDSPVSAAADFPIEVVVGPEFVTGSTRMKSGTAQKLVLNMISTSVMIQLGRVEDNKMVNMQLTNDKLVDRGTRMLMERIRIQDYDKAKELLLQFGSVKKAADSVLK